VSNPSTTRGTPLQARFQETLEKRRLLPRGAHLLVAVSGGQDSLCLGQLLLDFRALWRWEIAIAHCDHQWSYDLGVAEHVRAIVDRWQVPFYLEIAPPMAETEANAREWRYSALTRVAQEEGFSFLLTGHTMSDRAETFLYHLARGAGVQGLASLPWERPLGENLSLIRPLLNFSRAETLAFCQARELAIWHDRANENLQYQRNRIRQELIPYLKNNVNPGIEKHLARTAEILQGENDYLEGIAQGIFEQCIDRENRRIDRLALRSLHRALQRRVIRHFLRLYLPSSPDFQAIEAVTDLIEAPNLDRTSSLPGNLSAQAHDRWIEL
jgi:tRNA(Ile)-lysidine synthase